MDVEVGRHRLVDGAQKAEELLVPMTLAALREDGAVEQVEGGEQGGGAMADVVVGDPLDVAEAQRQQRLGALQRLAPGSFSSTHRTSALSGGSRYSPTTSRSFSMKNGSVDSLKLSRRWGCSPNACKKRCTLVLAMPVSAARPRTLQWVAPSLGLACRVVVSSSAMRSSSIERGLPGRNSSCKPSMRRSTKRRRHLPTVAWVVPKRCATALLVAPAAHARTMLARRTSAAGSDRDRAIDCNCACSSSLNTSSASVDPSPSRHLPRRTPRCHTARYGRNWTPHRRSTSLEVRSTVGGNVDRRTATRRGASMARRRQRVRVRRPTTGCALSQLRTLTAPGRPTSGCRPRTRHSSSSSLVSGTCKPPLRAATGHGLPMLGGTGLARRSLSRVPFPAAARVRPAAFDVRYLVGPRFSSATAGRSPGRRLPPPGRSPHAAGASSCATRCPRKSKTG